MIIFYLLQISLQCRISGILYTPKLYPANNVRIQYESMVAMSNEKGEFEIIVNSKLIEGLMTFNIANQFTMSKYLQTSECPLVLNNIILDNHESVKTQINGCVIQSDTSIGASNAKLNITYDQPTLLDIQFTQTDENGCFSVSDQLMKLLVYKVTLTFSMRGYQHSIREVSLLDNYSYDMKEIYLVPQYYTVQLFINVIQSTQISISCGLEYKTQFVTQKIQTTLVLDKIFKESYQYNCGLLAQYNDLADFQILNIKEAINITINLNLHPINVKQSIIIGQIIDQKSQTMQNVEVTLNYLQNSVKQLTNELGKYTFYLDLDKSASMTLSISKQGYLSQEIQFTSPNPPFIYYVKQIKMQKKTAEVQYHFKVSGIVLTKFDDPVISCQVAIFKENKQIQSTESDEEGHFVLDATFQSSGEQIYLQVIHSKFQTYSDEFYYSSFKNIQCNTEDKKYIQCLDQQIEIQPNQILLTIKAQFEKKIEGSGLLWLDRVYYDSTHYANPSLNNTLKLSKAIKFSGQELKLEVPALDFYLYQLAIYIESDGLSNIEIKNSTQNHTVDFGIINLYNLTKQQHSKYYTQFNGKVIDMIDPSCQKQIQIPIIGAQIKFSLQFIRQSQFINMTTTDSNGLFNLIAYNPIINGQFSGFFIISKDGYLSNEIDITFLTKDENKQFTIGTVQLINENGLKEC